MSEREQFEAWYIKAHGPETLGHRESALAWSGWQAARRAPLVPDADELTGIAGQIERLRD